MKKIIPYIIMFLIVIYVVIPVIKSYKLAQVLPAHTYQVPITPPLIITGVPLGERTKTSECVAHDGLPDSACTPGAVFAAATKEQICTLGYSKSARNVSTKVKDQVFAEYGVLTHGPGEYEVDHLVSLELGGSNDIANLWPESAVPKPGFHEKDVVENYLHDQLCNGAMSLQQVQAQIGKNWLQVYTSLPPKQ